MEDEDGAAEYEAGAVVNEEVGAADDEDLNDDWADPFIGEDEEVVPDEYVAVDNDNGSVADQDDDAGDAPQIAKPPDVAFENNHVDPAIRELQQARRDDMRIIMGRFEQLERRKGEEDDRFNQQDREITQLRGDMDKLNANHDKETRRLERGHQTAMTKKKQEIDEHRRLLDEAYRINTMDKGTLDATRARLGHLLQEQTRQRLEADAPTNGSGKGKRSTAPPHVSKEEASCRVTVLYYKLNCEPDENSRDVKNKKTVAASGYLKPRQFESLLTMLTRTTNIAPARSMRMLKAQDLSVQGYVELKVLAEEEVEAWLREVKAKDLGKGGKPMVLNVYYFDPQDEAAANIAYSCHWN